MPLNGTSVSGHPSVATDGQRVLATQAFDGLSANMSGCLASPAYTIPAFVNQYNLTVDHWLSFSNDDAAWVEASLNRRLVANFDTQRFLHQHLLP